jgi:RecB family exonuclease
MEPGGAVESAARLLTVRFGATATDALAQTIAAAKAGDPLAPVTVVVPGNLTGLALRRQLGGRGDGVCNVRFFVLDRLAELLGAGTLAASGRRPLDDAVKAALVRQVLAAKPAPLTRVASAENTERAVIEMVDELRASGPAAVDALRVCSRRGHELAAIAERFRSVAAHSFYDAHDLAIAAARAVARGEADLRDIGQVVLHLPHRPSHAQLDLVDALAEVERVWAVIGLTGEAEADADAAELIERLSVSLGPARAITSTTNAPSTWAVSAPDAAGEVREAMRIIAAEVELGRPLHRIGVVYSQGEPYARLLDEELASAAIPMHGSSVRSLAQSVTGRTLLGALMLADDDFGRASVIRWMSAAPLRADGERLRPARWARVALRAGVVRGPEQWTDRLGQRATELEDAPLLAEYVAWLVAECGVDERESWAAWADWARAFMTKVLGSPAARRRWPEAELSAFDAVERVVEGLRSLVEIEPGPISRHAAVNHLEAMLAIPAGRRGSFGQGVLCGPLRHVVGVDLDVVVVLGMAEGDFPPTGVESAVLSRAERDAVGSPFAPRARARDERRTYLAAVASAPHQWLLTPRAAGGQVAHPAPWLADVPEERWASIESFDAELARPSGPPASLHERDLRELRLVPGGLLSNHPIVTANPGLARGFDAVAARLDDSFSEWEGNVGEHAELAIADTLLSATSLQTWAGCPARYFFKQVLHVREQDDVKDVDELEARHRGSLVHLILEKLGREHLDRYLAGADQMQLPLDELSWTATAREVVEQVTRDVLDDFERRGSAPYEILWDVEKKRILRDVLRTLDTDAADVELMAVEHGFGGDEKPFTIELPSGETLRFRGMIDRIDRLHDRLRVIDYKTGTTETEASVRAGIASGTLLQLPIYGLAAQAEFDPAAPVAAGYWYVSSKGGWKDVIIPIDDAIQERFLHSLETISTGIGDGVFPAHPGKEDWFSFENCKYCEYDRICPADRDRAWERLQHADELASYRELSKPIEAEDSDDD